MLPEPEHEPDHYRASHSLEIAKRETSKKRNAIGNDI
jgi:hypothetical protein